MSKTATVTNRRNSFLPQSLDSKMLDNVPVNIMTCDPKTCDK